MTSHQGQLLIASPRLLDPNFIRTVVLVVQHDDNGAMGLVLNRALELDAAGVLAQAIDGEIAVTGRVHQGGPCEGPLMVLHTWAKASQIDLGNGMHFTAERGDVERLVRGKHQPLKFFANYAGWGPGQLESEIEEGSWRLYPATETQVFAPVKQQWSKLLLVTQSGGRLTPERIPDDPSVN